MKIYEADGQFSSRSWGEIPKVNNWLPGYTKSRNCRAVHLPSDHFIRLPTSPLSRMLKCWIWGIALLHYCIKIFANIQLSFLSHIWDVDLAFRALINMRFWVRVGKYQSVKCHASPGSCRGAEQSRAERSSYISSAGAAASSCCISVQTPELGRAGEGAGTVVVVGSITRSHPQAIVCSSRTSMLTKSDFFLREVFGHPIILCVTFRTKKKLWSGRRKLFAGIF